MLASFNRYVLVADDTIRPPGCRAMIAAVPFEQRFVRYRLCRMRIPNP